MKHTGTGQVIEIFRGDFMKRIPSGWIFISSLMLFLLTVAITLPEWPELLPPMPEPQQLGDWLETILIQLQLIS